MYRRDAVRGLQTPSETNFSYNESTYGQSSFSSETNPYRQFNSRDEPPQKKRRRNPSFPDVDTRYVLGSHKVPSHGNGDDPTTPHSASVSFGDNYFSQQTMQDRPNESPSRGFIAQSSRQYGYNPSSQYLTPDSSRSYQGQFSNRFAMGTDLTAGFGGSTEPGRHHYTSSAESQNSVAAPTAMHPPVLGANRQSETTDSRYWQGSFENATYTPYHSRGSSSSAVPTGNLLPAPMNLQPRPSVENGMNSM